MTETFEAAKNLFLEGLQHFEAGRFTDAEDRFQCSLALIPGRVSILINLGATRLRLGKPQQALDALTQVLAIEPDNLDAWFHRGTALRLLERPEEALVCYDNVLTIDSRHRAALYHRGFTLNILKRHDEALRSFEQLVVLHSDHSEAWWRHGQTLQELERYEDALVSYEKALAIDPKFAPAWSQRGCILKDMRRLDEAALCFKNAIAHGHDAELNQYLLASVVGQGAPTAAPKQYVQNLFDSYADKFDEHLVQMLNYRTPAVLVENLQGLGGARFDAALDLGCGTGLCGPLVKPMVNRLDGVDLSGNMIEKARALGVYDRLARADIAEHLQTTERRYDLVLAADVFVYLGELASVFRGVQRALNLNGVFCFSVELTDDGKDFQLLPSSRYAHSQRYIRDMAEQVGFETIKLLEHPLREHQQKPVSGLFVYLTRK